MSSTGSQRATGPRQPQPGERAIAPFRRPKPSRQGLALFGLWALGGLFGTIAPALVVPPTSAGASIPRSLTAFGLTVVGVAVMVLACWLMYRRGKEGGVLIFAVVPTGVLLAGGLMMLGTQLFR